MKVQKCQAGQSAGIDKCPVCRSTDLTTELMAPDFYLSKGMSELFRVAFCNSCQLGFSYPKMDYQELSRYYPNEYIPYQPRLGLKGWLRKVKFGTDYKIMRRSCEAVKDCFEVGAGSGEFLSYLKNAGLSVAGLEQSIEGCRVAAQIFEIDLKNSNAEGYLFSQTYDCVIARYVLEHLNAPIEVLSNIYTNGLSAKGILFLKLPRYDSWEREVWLNHWLGIDLPRHRIHFTAEGISKILNGIGFREVKVYNDRVPFDFIRSFLYSRIPLFYPEMKRSLRSSLKGLFLSIIYFAIGKDRSGRMVVVARK